MKKLVNSPKNYVSEMLEGLYAAHSDVITPFDNNLNCLLKKKIKPGKVSLVTGGGSGHLPLFLGYVGDGMMDGCAVGGVFQSPSADDILHVTKAVEAGSGVLYIIGNYNGDKFNFKMAGDMAAMEHDIETAIVIGNDDIAAGPLPDNDELGLRRGVAGIFFIYKCAGAAAEDMLSLEEVKEVAKSCNENIRTLGVALSPCIVPRVGLPSFEIQDDEMEIGTGIHGEPGVRRGKLLPADQIVDEIMGALIADLPFGAGDEVAILVNGLGATPLEEQYIVFRRVKQILKENNITCYRAFVGEFATSLEMAGLSISMFRLNEQTKKYLDQPANTILYRQF